MREGLTLCALSACALVLPVQVAPTFSQTAGNNGSLESLELRSGVDALDGSADVQVAPQPQPSTVTLNTINPNGRVQRAQPVGAVDATTIDTTSVVGANPPASPVQTGITRPGDENPFAGEGLRLGNTNVLLLLEQSIGYSSNVAQDVGGSSGAFSQTDFLATFTSDWSRHELQTNISGSYRKPFTSDATDELLMNADTALRLDLIDGYALTTSAFYDAETQEFTDTTLAPGAVDTPLIQTYGGALELERTERKLRFSLRGAIEREVYDDADLGNGITQSQEDLNSNLYTGSVRVGYEMSPALVPFVEGIYSTRSYDLSLDRNGNRRDSDSTEFRAGIEVDMGEKLTGEVAAGYLAESYEDPRLEELSGFTLNGSLDWSPQRDTVVSLTFGTETNSSISANEAGDFTYNAELAIAHQVTDRLSWDAFVAIEVETNDAQNTDFDAGIGVQYWVNRFMALIGDVEYSSFSSDVPNSDFDEVSIRAGIRLQR